MSIEQERQEQVAPSRGIALPPDFLWGAATSAYQIEGAARTDGRGSSIWDDFAATPGKIRQGAHGDIACDHYHHMQEDVELMAALGLNSYCFSVSWPRVLPEGRGRVNQAGLDFYDRLVDALLAKGISSLPGRSPGPAPGRAAGSSARPPMPSPTMLRSWRSGWAIALTTG